MQGYTDEPISKILASMGEAEPVMLDRWELHVEKNPDAPPCGGDNDGSHHQSRDTLPLSVVNNYFSFGVDAQIALDFHEARGGSLLLHSALCQSSSRHAPPIPFLLAPA